MHVEGVRSPLAEQTWRARVRRAAKLSDRIITVSQSSRADIEELFPAVGDRIEVIYHGIDRKFFEERSPDKARLHELGFPESFYLYLGNLDPRKNLVRLVQAAEAVYEETGIQLVVAGAPAWRSTPSLRAVQGSPAVAYVGRLPEDALVDALRSAHVFVFPSLYEGFGLPVLEAMASGTAVVCSSRGSLAELASKAALIVEPEDSDDISAGIYRLLTDERERQKLSTLGRKLASGYTWDESIAHHSRVFHEVGGF